MNEITHINQLCDKISAQPITGRLGINSVLNRTLSLALYSEAKTALFYFRNNYIKFFFI